MKKNVVCYYRYSSQLQNDGFSIEAQRRACSEFAIKNDYNIVREYIDRAFSGTNDDRPEFTQLISDSKKSETLSNISVIVPDSSPTSII